MSWKDLFGRKKPEKQTQTRADNGLAAETEPQSAEDRRRAENEERLKAAKQQHKTGDIESAEAVYLEILEEDPAHAEARHMAGIVCLQRGQVPQAERYFRDAIALDDQQANFHLNLGNALGAQNRAREAYECFHQAVELDPENLAALSNAASALLSMGRSAEARPYCLKILEIEPGDAEARLSLAVACIEDRDTHAAIEQLRKGLEIQPDHIGLLIQLASALELVNQLDEAASTIERVEALQPGNPRVSLLAGLIARRQQKFELAEQRLQEAIELGLPPSEEIEALNQLGLALDASGKSQQAFTAFERSNQGMIQFAGARRANGPAFLREVADIKEYFSAEKLAGLGEKFETDDDFQPVFFVGFPRSGTTLMEQVLKAHPDLLTTDERSPLYAVIREINASGRGYPQAIDGLMTNDLIRYRHYFRDFCRENVGDLEGKRLVDKLPLNIVNLGLVRLLFPHAKIVVALRDPRDVCLSCFMQKFDLNDAMANFLDIRTSGQAYQSVMDLWLHYRSVLAGSWMEYRYESLVENFDETVTSVLDFIGVGWHEDIAGYRQAAEQRAITTPSYRDVTAPVNTSAVARWRRYEQELAPILPVLQPFIEEFGYD